VETSLSNSDADFNFLLTDLEDIIYQKAIEWAKETYRNILEYIDDQIKQKRSKDYAIVRTGGAWHITKFGTVRVKRRYYRNKDGTYHFLLDELLGMDKHRHTTQYVKKLALDMAGVMPYRRSSEIIDKTTPINLSHQTIHRIVARIADDCLIKQDAALNRFKETGELPDCENKVNDRIVIEADGVMLSLQRESKRKAEAKLGIAYEGWKKVGKNRYKTDNKSVYSDVVNSDTFWSAMTLKLSRKYEFSCVNHMVLGGDGAGWIREGAEYFGGCYQLCRFHLNRALTRTLGYDSEVLKSIRNSLTRGDTAAIFSLLDNTANSAKGDKRIDIKKLSNYLSSNLSGLKIYPKVDSEWRGTGAIEGNIDKFIARRMKNQGMSWSVQGIRRMLWLRIAIYENKLDEYLAAKPDTVSSFKLPNKTIRKVVDKKLKQDYSQYFNAGLPAVIGTDASKPWVKVLKNIVEGPMI
jgi:hypothetical protein